MDIHRMDSLFMRVYPQYRNKNKFLEEYLNLKVDLNLRENIRGNVGHVVKLGTIRRIADIKILRKRRDLMMPLPYT